MSEAVNAERRGRAWLMPAGFLVACLGLALATYSYTPPRTYDITYAGAALFGFFLMFGGIVLAGHARARGGRRKIGKRSASTPLRAPAKPAPVEREPRAKRSFSLARFGKRPATPGLALAFKRRPRPVTAEPVPVPAAKGAPLAPLVEKFELQCPRCSTRFSAAGARPFPIRCPACDLTGTLTGVATQTARVDVDLTPIAGAPVPSPSPPASLSLDPAPSTASGIERFSLQCPRCGAAFTAEGARPVSIACPSCGLTGTLR